MTRSKLSSRACARPNSATISWCARYRRRRASPHRRRSPSPATYGRTSRATPPMAPAVSCCCTIRMSPSGAWHGPLRIVSFAQAPLEPEIGTDPLLADVTWSWLIGRCARFARCRAPLRHAHSHEDSVDRFRLADGEGNGAQIELRASWSPVGDPRAHVEAWAELVCMLAGLPQVGEDRRIRRSESGT